MSLLIDHTYFIGEINISNTDRPDIQERIGGFIAKHEPQWLEKVMGYELKKNFLAGLDAAEPDQMWLDLRDGVEYTSRDGYLVKWPGLLNVTEKRSAIANYVYYFWQRDNISHTVNIGETAAKAENSTVVSPRYKMIRAWNEMACTIQQLMLFLNAPDNDYPGWSSSFTHRILREFRQINEFGF